MINLRLRKLWRAFGAKPFGLIAASELLDESPGDLFIWLTNKPRDLRYAAAPIDGNKDKPLPRIALIGVLNRIVQRPQNELFPELVFARTGAVQRPNPEAVNPFSNGPRPDGPQNGRSLQVVNPRTTEKWKQDKPDAVTPQKLMDGAADREEPVHRAVHDRTPLEHRCR